MDRLRWWSHCLIGWLRYSTDARIAGGTLLAFGLAVGGFALAKTAASSSASTGNNLVRITTRLPVTETVHGRQVVRYRRKVVYARASTSYQTQTIHTPTGTKVVTHPVTHYHVVYRKKVITRNGKTRTVLQPVTTTSQLTNTDLVTTTVVSNRTVTDQVTVTNVVTTTVVHGTTETVTVPVTTTLVSTETETLPVTVTVTVPGTG
jgi:hypothetical protein